MEPVSIPVGPSLDSAWSKLIKQAPTRSPKRSLKTDFAQNSRAFKEYKEKTKDLLHVSRYSSFSSHHESKSGGRRSKSEKGREEITVIEES